MADINHFEISRLLQSRLKPVTHEIGFGGFRLGGILAEVNRSLVELPIDSDPRSAFDVQIIDAFESVRNGNPVDAILFDEKIRQDFEDACFRNGVNLPPVEQRRRLLAIRKSTQSGIPKLKATTVRRGTPNAIKRHMHAVEITISKVRLITGLSIDEIFLRDETTADFFASLSRLIPSVKKSDAIQCVLYLRKTRNTRPSSKQIDPKVMSAINLEVLDKQLNDGGKLKSIDLSLVPNEPGFFQINHRNVPVLAGNHPNLHELSNEIILHNPFVVIPKALWEIKPESVTLKFRVGSTLENIPIKYWTQKYIAERKPIFNLPIAA